MKFHTYLVIILICTNSYAQVTPPCGNDYGSSSDETNIVSQMRYRSIIDAESAINLAKNTRGTSLGCPQIGLTYATSNISQPTLASIETRLYRINREVLLKSELAYIQLLSLQFF